MNIEDLENKVLNYQNKQVFVDLKAYISQNYKQFCNLFDENQQLNKSYLDYQERYKKIKEELQNLEKQLFDTQQIYGKLILQIQNETKQWNQQELNNQKEETQQIQNEIKQLEIENENILTNLKTKLYYKEYEMMIKERDGLLKKNAFLRNKLQQEQNN